MAEHKAIKNEACSLGLLERYRGEDCVSPRIDPARKIVALPRPAGVMLALTPSTNPVVQRLLQGHPVALLTRNAIVDQPAPDGHGHAAPTPPTAGRARRSRPAPRTA